MFFHLFQITKLETVGFYRFEPHELRPHKLKPADGVLYLFVVVAYEGDPRRIHSVVCHSVENKISREAHANAVERGPEAHASVEVLRIEVGVQVHFMLESVQVLGFFKQVVEFVFAPARLAFRGISWRASHCRVLFVFALKRKYDV